MNLVRTDPPTTYAVTLEQAKTHLRVTDALEDGLIGVLISAAQEAVEDLCDRAVTPQKWRLSLPAFPAGAIALYRCPVTSIESIVYVAPDGTETTLAAGDYELNADAEPATVAPAYGKTWPATREVQAAVKVTFAAGWATTAQIPARICQAMLLAIGNWFENRETAGELPDGAKALVWGLKVW